MQAYRELSCNFVEDPPQPISWPDYVPFTVEQLFRPYVLFVRVTTPFINTQLMSQFIDDYLEHHEQYGSSVSVVKIKSQLFDHNQQPINSGIGDEHKNTQEIEEIYYEVAGISIAKREDALRYHYHYAPNPHLFIVDPFHGLDINYPEEWELAQSLAKSDILE